MDTIQIHPDKWTPQTHMDTDVVQLPYFALFVTCMYAKDTNLYLACHRYTHAQIHKHMHTHLQRHQHIQIHTCTQTYISTHADIQTHMHIFLHTQTHIYVRSILPAHFIFSCHLPNELRSYFYF